MALLESSHLSIMGDTESRFTVIVCLLALVVLSACTVALTEDYFFHPEPAQAKARSEFGSDSEPITVDRPDGAKLNGVYVQHSNARVDILYFGGDSFKVDDFGPALAAATASVPANLFVVDYRGYGRSTGKPSLADLKSDALVLFDTLNAQNRGRPIIVHGFSMGSFLAAYVASNRPAAGLVLESTATSVKAWSDSQVPWYAKPFLRIHIAPALIAVDNIQSLSHYHGPLLLVTGERDSVTPPRFARELSAASPTPRTRKRVVIPRGKQHGDAFFGSEAIAAYSEFARLVTSLPAAATTRPCSPPDR